MTQVKYVTKKGMFERTGMDALGYADPKKDEILLRKNMPKALEKTVRHHESEHIRKGEEGPFLDSIGASIPGFVASTAVSSLLRGIGGDKASGQLDDATAQALALSQFQPWNLSSGFANTSFDKKGKSGSSRLNDLWAARRDAHLGRSGMFYDQLKDFFAPQKDDYITGYETEMAIDNASALNNLKWGGPKNSVNARFSNIAYPIVNGKFVPVAVKPGHSVADANAELKQIANESTSGGEFLQKLVQATKGGGSHITAPAGGGYIRSDIGNIDRGRPRSMLGAFGGEKEVQGDAIYDEEAYQQAVDEWVPPAERYYRRLSRMAEPFESAQRSALESRLYKQGLLGAAGGVGFGAAAGVNPQKAALEYSLGEKDLKRAYDAISQAEWIQNQIQNRGLKEEGAAVSIEDQTNTLLQQAINAGAAQASAGANAARYAYQTGLNNADATSSFWGSLAQGADNAIQGLFNSPTTGQSYSGPYGVNYRTTYDGPFGINMPY